MTKITLQLVGHLLIPVLKTQKNPKEICSSIILPTWPLMTATLAWPIPKKYTLHLIHYPCFLKEMGFRGALNIKNKALLNEQGFVFLSISMAIIL